MQAAKVSLNKWATFHQDKSLGCSPSGKIKEDRNDMTHTAGTKAEEKIFIELFKSFVSFEAATMLLHFAAERNPIANDLCSIYF